MDNKNLSQYDNMTTKELERLMYIDASLPKPMGLDMKTYLYICCILAERARVESEEGKNVDFIAGNVYNIVRILL